MFLVVFRPARREAVGGEAEGPAEDRKDEAERVDRQAAPARASSTSVACATPVAPRAPNGCALR